MHAHQIGNAAFSWEIRVWRWLCGVARKMTIVVGLEIECEGWRPRSFSLCSLIVPFSSRARHPVHSLSSIASQTPKSAGRSLPSSISSSLLNGTTTIPTIADHRFNLLTTVISSTKVEVNRNAFFVFREQYMQRGTFTSLVCLFAEADSRYYNRYLPTTDFLSIEEDVLVVYSNIPLQGYLIQNPYLRNQTIKLGLDNVDPLDLAGIDWATRLTNSFIANSFITWSGCLMNYLLFPTEFLMNKIER